ncbi:Galactose operon repressor [Cronobacter sakazakii]|nr:Galactose operon repressor [Cronobacter sakazakii]
MSTINDVARLARVSKATVSRVLSGNRGVKEESRLAVLRAAEMLNYQPNAIAQSLSSQNDPLHRRDLRQRTYSAGYLLATGAGKRAQPAG